MFTFEFFLIQTLHGIHSEICKMYTFVQAIVRYMGRMNGERLFTFLTLVAESSHQMDNLCY